MSHPVIVFAFVAASAMAAHGLQSQAPQAPAAPVQPPAQVEQPGRKCLHGPEESERDYQRRVDAFRAMRLIDDLLVDAVFPGVPRGPVPTWQGLSRSSKLPYLRGMGGPLGDLARKIDWASSEPLPGWAIEYNVTDKGVLFSLTDTLDPCRFKYSSDDPRVLPPRQPGVRPLRPDTGD